MKKQTDQNGKEIMKDKIIDFLKEIYNDHTVNGSHRIKARQLLESLEHVNDKLVITAMNYNGDDKEIIIHFNKTFDSTKMNVKKIIECLQEMNDGSFLSVEIKTIDDNN